jgi:hypothetical protein
MNAAARKEYERHARLNRWAAWAGMAIVGLAVAAALPLALGTWWLAASLFLSM